jgi:general secretion pathway protein I
VLARRRSRGYTLIEVLVAFVILAMALTVLLRIFSGGVRNVAVSSDYAKAVLIAESRLATAGIDDTLAPGETDGIENGRFRWTRVVTDYEPTSSYQSTVKGLRAYHVTVTVSWPNGDKERQVELNTVRLMHEGRRS